MAVTEVQKIIDYCDMIKLNMQHRNSIMQFSKSGAPKHDVALFAADRMIKHMQEITETVKRWNE